MLKRNRKKGQSIVEMSLLFPVFLLVIVGGIVDFGFAFYNALALQQLVNDAAAISAEKDYNQYETLSYIQNYPATPMGWSQSGIYTPQVTRLYMSDDSTMIRVEISYKSKTYTPFYQTMFSAVSGDEFITLRTQATYKVPNVVTARPPILLE